MTSENDLLIRIRNADEEAFRQMFDLYIKKVYHFILGYIKEKSEAEDITQNVFIKIWEKRATIDINKSFEGFIFTIAYRMVVDYFRQDALRFQEKDTHNLIEATIISPGSSDDMLNLHQLESLYEQSLERLPPKRKEIYLLSRHSGLSNKQIAEQLGISVKTVENQMTAALASLKEFFSHSDLNPLVIFFLLIAL